MREGSVDGELMNWLIALFGIVVVVVDVALCVL